MLKIKHRTIFLMANLTTRRQTGGTSIYLERLKSHKKIKKVTKKNQETGKIEYEEINCTLKNSKLNFDTNVNKGE